MDTSVVKYESLCMNLAVRTVKDFEIWQVDYTSAYLNTPTQIPILMEQPESYEVHPSDIYRVNVTAGKQVWGGTVRNCGDEKEDSEKTLVSLLDKAIYETIDRAHNWW